MLVRACIARLPRSNDGASETGSSRPLLFWARVVENDTQKDKEGHRGGAGGSVTKHRSCVKLGQIKF